MLSVMGGERSPWWGNVGTPMEARDPWASQVSGATLPGPSRPVDPIVGSGWTFGSAGPPGPATPARLSLLEILGGDPFYQQGLANLRAASASDRSGLRAARQRAIIQFGEAPGFAGVGEGFAEDIDATTRAAAEAATRSGVSMKARLAAAHADAINSIRKNLLARGMSRSGELGHLRGQEAQQYTNAQFDARQQVADYLAGVNAGYVEAERQRKLLETQAQQGSLDDWLKQNPNAGGTAAPPAPPGGSPSGLPSQPRPNATWTPATKPSGFDYGGGLTGWWR